MDHPADDSLNLRLAAFGEVLDAAEVVMAVFRKEGKPSLAGAFTPKAIKAARVMAAGDASAARAGVRLVAALVRWIAEETGRSEDEVIQALRGGERLLAPAVFGGHSRTLAQTSVPNARGPERPGA